nr:RNA polymerase sigma factor [Antribacter gilvus]
MAEVDSGAGNSPSDAELILRVRDGDRDAFGALYSRHVQATRQVARCLVAPSDVEEVVSDSFESTFQTLLRGKGPDLNFRGYILTVVRNTATTLARGVRRTRPTADDELEHALGRLASDEDPALAGFERTVVFRAYLKLPERYRMVLHYALVEEHRPAQIAPLLGLSPNGVSALLYRAKEALRAGYLQQHLSHAPSAACREVNRSLGEYVRDSLSKREKAKVDDHLTGCGTCSALVLELHDVAHGMKCVVAPLMLGVAGLGLVGVALPIGGTGTAVLLKAGYAAAAAKAGTTTVLTSSAGSVASGSAVGTGAVTTSATTASTVGAGAGTVTSTAVGTVSTVTSTAGTSIGGGSVGSGVTAAASTAASTAATTSTVAGVAAGATGALTSTGMAAGAITAATVGVAAVLQVLAPMAQAERFNLGLSAGSVLVADAPASDALDEVPDVLDPTSATNLLVPMPAPEPAKLGVALSDPTTVLQPRVGQDIVLTLSNSGGRDAAETVVRLTLPDGLTARFAQAPFGAGVGSSAGSSTDAAAPTTEPATTTEAAATTGTAATTTAATTDVREEGTTEAASGVGAGDTAGDIAGDAAVMGPPITANRFACGPADGGSSNTVLCELGTVAAGTTQRVVVGVQAQSGGVYPISAEVWAAGVKSAGVELAAAEVAPYGAELSAHVDGTDIANPGSTVVGVEVANTGDLTAPAGWSVDVTLPAGVTPAASQSALSCASHGSASNAWHCSPLPPGDGTAGDLMQGERRRLPLAVVADGTAPGTTSGAVAVTPVLPGSAKVLQASGPVSVAQSWAGAVQGAGSLDAQCLATGGTAVAQSAVTGTYTNRTAQTVSVTLEAAGTAVASAHAVRPGEQVLLQVPDGLRVPAGPGAYVLSAVVDGRTYTTRVPAGTHPARDCYAPSWDVAVAARTVNVNGAVGVRGDVTNHTDEPVQVVMVVPAGGTTLESGQVTIEPGATVPLQVATGTMDLAAAQAAFRLSRWTTDSDGDLPTHLLTAPEPPVADYPAAVLAPAAGAAQRVGECTYDPERDYSTRTFAAPVDNTGSTLPVVFSAAGATLFVPAGEKATLTFTVPWGTGQVDLTADGRTLATEDVTFRSCARIVWPESSVTVTPLVECTDGTGRIVADVHNAGARAWNGRMYRTSRWTTGTTVEIPPGGTARLTLGDDVVPGGRVTVRLNRELEGRIHAVERRLTVDAVVCPPPAPPTPSPEPSPTHAQVQPPTQAPPSTPGTSQGGPAQPAATTATTNQGDAGSRDAAQADRSGRASAECAAVTAPWAAVGRSGLRTAGQDLWAWAVAACGPKQ